MKIVRLMHDDSPENPCEWDGWQLYSFSRKHINHRDPSEFNPSEDEELTKKLEGGLAFFLDCYQHSGTAWSLHGEGMQCQWDTARNAGVLMWGDEESGLGPKTYAERRANANSFLETYNAWCNGAVYGFSVTDHKLMPCGHYEDEDLGGCFGWYDDGMGALKGMEDEVKALVGGDLKVSFEGDAAWLAQYHDFGQEKKRRTA